MADDTKDDGKKENVAKRSSSQSDIDEPGLGFVRSVADQLCDMLQKAFRDGKIKHECKRVTATRVQMHAGPGETPEPDMEWIGETGHVFWDPRKTSDENRTIENVNFAWTLAYWYMSDGGTRI